MALSWSGRRQLLYYAVGALVLLVLGILLWQVFFSKASTCFDGAQNNGERGVDCGGSCALICPMDAKAPVVLWYRAFSVSPSVYNAVAYVKNQNVGAGAKNVRYSFKLYDERNVLVKEQVGVADIPPAPLVPIIETGITVGNRTVVSTKFEFSDEEIHWVKNTKEIPPVRATQQSLSVDGSRLSTTIVNDSVEDVRGLVVTAVLFDGAGVARAASKSTIARLARRSFEEVVFTWGAGVPNIVRAEIILLPSF